MKLETKEIHGFEGLYEVSSTGEVYSIRGKRKALKISKDKHGYCRVNLYKNKKAKVVFVHRVVATSFIENKENMPYVNHLNSNPCDNRVENLEWVTHQGNMDHMVKSGRTAKGEATRDAKLTNMSVLTILTLKDHPHWSNRKLGEIFKVSKATARMARKGTTWKHIYERVII